jgi:four helix bundle protein
MASKLKTVEEESDECCYWLELLEESGTASSDAIIPLAQEAREIFRITVASVKTIRATQRQKPESTD